MCLVLKGIIVLHYTIHKLDQFNGNRNCCQSGLFSLKFHFMIHSKSNAVRQMIKARNNSVNPVKPFSDALEKIDHFQQIVFISFLKYCIL